MAKRNTSSFYEQVLSQFGALSHQPLNRRNPRRAKTNGRARRNFGDGFGSDFAAWAGAEAAKAQEPDYDALPSAFASERQKAIARARIAKAAKRAGRPTRAEDPDYWEHMDAQRGAYLKSKKAKSKGKARKGGRKPARAPSSSKVRPGKDANGRKCWFVGSKYFYSAAKAAKAAK